MLRLPAVSGRFYPSDPVQLTSIIHRFTQSDPNVPKVPVKACLVPHAGYVYSGSIAGAAFSRIVLPRKILILGVRHFPRGEQVAIISSGSWRTPLGDAPIDEPLAQALRAACPLFREDEVAHRREHSLEVQIPFLQVLSADFAFVPVALGTLRFEELASVGEAVGKVLAESPEDILLLTTSDFNHYENDEITRVKDHKAIRHLLALDAQGLYDTCRTEKISMCGLGPAVAMITAMRMLSSKEAEILQYATSADVSGDTSSVVGYAGMIFR